MSNSLLAGFCDTTYRIVFFPIVCHSFKLVCIVILDITRLCCSKLRYLGLTTSMHFAGHPRGARAAKAGSFLARKRRVRSESARYTERERENIHIYIYICINVYIFIYVDENVYTYIYTYM